MPDVWNDRSFLSQELLKGRDGIPKQEYLSAKQHQQS